MKPVAPIRPEEIWFAVGFLLMPFLMVWLAYLTKTYSNPRYVLPTVFGVALILAGLAWQANRFYRPFALLAGAVLLFFFARMELVRVHRFSPQKEMGLASLRDAIPAGVPIYVNDPVSFVRTWHTWPEQDRVRLRYAYDLDLAQQGGRRQLEFNIQTLESRSKGAIFPFRTVSQQPSSLLLYFSPANDDTGWLFKKLLDQHAKFRLLGRLGGDLLFEVQREAHLTR